MAREPNHEACPAENAMLAYLEGGLAPDAAESIDEHLDSCPTCRRVVLLAARSPALEPTTPALAATTPADAGAVPPLSTRLPRGAQIGRYLVLDVLGEGGMGIVYAAFDPELDRKIAVKVLRPELAGDRATTRLLREGRAIARLAHPNVVTVFDVGTHDGSVFVAMELVDGASLDKWLAVPRPWRDVVERFVQAGRGLTAAHEAGIIHRDFKPANVLVGKDGRVRVTDFGLARIDPSERPSRPDHDAAADVTLTRTGAIMGTPAYMAPEQFEAGGVDERTDQFSFAVALYEGLYGQRPFQATTAAAIYDQIVAGEIAPLPTGTRVPARLRALVVRGLARKPDQRHARLADLLASLDAIRRPRVPRWIAAAGVLAAIGATYAIAHGSSEEACAGAQPKIAEVWNLGTRARMQQAFLATGKPFATPAFAQAAGAIDRYAASWADMHVDACRATAVRREQSAELLDLRMTCLEQRRSQLHEIVELFGSADAAVVEHANEVVGHLGEIAGCADLAALRSPVALPSSPVMRAQLEDLRRQLARAIALSDAGKAHDALPTVAIVLSRARSLGFSSMVAQALQVQGELQYDDGDNKGSIGSLRAAIVAAEASGDSLVDAQAWTRLVLAIGYGTGDHSGALEAADHARAILGRIGPDGLEMAALDSVVSTVLRDKGDLGGARDAVTRALAIYKHRLPPGDPEIARALGNLATVEWYDGKLEPAIAMLLEARTDLERALGRQHPHLAKIYSNLSAVYRQQGKLDAASAANRQALEIDEAARGPDHPEIAVLLMSKGNIAADLGRDDEAIAAYRRALAITEKARGADHPTLGNLLNNLAVIEQRRGDLAAAHDDAARALAIYEKRFGPDHLRVATAMVNLADIDADAGRLDEARHLAETSLAIERAKLDLHDPEIAETYISLGDIASLAGRPSDAIADHEKAVAILEHSTKNRETLALALFHYGKVLATAGRVENAETVLRRALTMFETERGPQHPTIADILTALADVQSRRGNGTDAASAIERALAIEGKTKPSPRHLAVTQAIAARILWQSSADRVRARELARQALPVLANIPGEKEQHDTLARWMAARRIE